MSSKSGFRSLLVATGSFIGGVALGVLLTPKNGRQNRALIYQHTADISNWIDRQRKAASQKGKTELHNIRKHVQDGLKQHIPDLYEATEKIDMGNHQLTDA